MYTITLMSGTASHQAKVVMGKESLLNCMPLIKNENWLWEVYVTPDYT